MTFGNIDVEIYNENFQSCLAEKLDGSGNDFKPGAIDVFTVSYAYNTIRSVKPH